MKVLIYKDLLLIKGYFKNILIIFACILFLGISNPSFLPFTAFYFPFFSFMLVIGTFNYDEYSHWDEFALTLPIEKRNIVFGKYLLTIGSIAIFSLLGLGITLLGDLVSPQSVDILQIATSLLGSIIGILLVTSIMYPCIYKYGAQKGRIIMFAVAFVIVMVVLAISFLGGSLFKDVAWFASLEPFLEKYIFYILLAVMVIMVYISYRISCKLYINRKD